MTAAGLVDADAFAPSGRPLLIVDVDEVILRFVGPLSDFLAARGLDLMPRSFALTGNVVRRGGSEAIDGGEVAAAIADFFAAEVETQPPVDGALAAIARLAAAFEVVVLTAVPAAQGARRARRLAALGLAAPILLAEGPKGPRVAALAEAARAAAGRPVPVVFVDDGPTHLASTRERDPAVRLVHFVDDPRWFALAPEVPGTWLRSRDWAEVAAAVQSLL